MVTPSMVRVMGGVPEPGGAASDRAATAAENRREVGVHLGRNGKGGGGVSDYRGVYLEKAEHGHTVHFYAISYGHV